MFTLNRKVERRHLYFIILFLLSIFTYVTISLFISGVFHSEKSDQPIHSTSKLIETENSNLIKRTEYQSTFKSIFAVLEKTVENEFKKKQMEDSFEYRVQNGDTLSEIANIFDISLSDLMVFNNITNPHLIHPSDIIHIPSKEKAKAIIASISISRKPLTLDDFLNLDLRKPSNLTVESLGTLLKGTGLEGLEKAFIDAEKKYNINALYLVAHAIHESDWGNSKIAIDKNNLFGYKAYDADPYNNAMAFSSKEASIDHVARFVSQYYLDTNGKYFNGPNLAGMNKNYATSKDWSYNIAGIMKKFSKRIKTS